MSKFQFQIIYYKMEAKISVYTTYNAEPYLTQLEDSIDWFAKTKKNDSYTSCELVAFSIIGLIIIYVLCCVIRWIYLYAQIAPDIIYNRENCPICLHEFTAPVRVNCGHAFCIECLHTYFTVNPTNYNCPLCRSLVQNFECLNTFVFGTKHQAHDVQLEEQLRNRISNQNVSKARILQEKYVIVFVVAYIFIIGGISWLVQLF